MPTTLTNQVEPRRKIPIPSRKWRFSITEILINNNNKSIRKKKDTGKKGIQLFCFKIDIKYGEVSRKLIIMLIKPDHTHTLTHAHAPTHIYIYKH